jgi:hypothetical protein
MKGYLWVIISLAILAIVSILFFVPFNLCLDGGSSAYFLPKYQVLPKEAVRIYSVESGGFAAPEQDITVGQIINLAGDLRQANFDYQTYAVGYWEHLSCRHPILRESQTSYYLGSWQTHERLGEKEFYGKMQEINASCSGCLIVYEHSDG